MEEDERDRSHRNVGDMIRNIKQQLGAGDCLGTLEIHGHGGPWGINLDGVRPEGDIRKPIEKARRISENNVVEFAAILKQLDWCDSIYNKLILTGCNTGLERSKPRDPSWIQVLANELGIAVRTTGGFCRGTHFHGDITTSAKSEDGVQFP